jgi:O-antigen ligase
VIDVAVLKIVGFACVALLVIAWLAVSFLAPGKARSRLAWVAATCMFLALLCFFVNLFQIALRAESTVGMIAFGFLMALFIAGLVVSAVKTAGEFIGRASRSGPTL